MVLTFIFRQGLPGKCIHKRTKNQPNDGLPSLELIFRPFANTFSWKFLTKNKGKDHIYLDKFGMGSIYVIKYRFYEEYRDYGNFGQYPITYL